MKFLDGFIWGGGFAVAVIVVGVLAHKLFGVGLCG